MQVLTLCWDPESGEAYANLNKIDQKLEPTVDKLDFLSDAIGMLTEKYNNSLSPRHDDYKEMLENEEE